MKHHMHPEPGPEDSLKVVRSIHAPSDAVLFDRTTYGGECVLRCPVCVDEFTHVQAVYTLLGGDESCGLYRGSDLVARKTDYRRDALAVRVQGETCGHRWDLVFQQHKGQTFLRVDILEPIMADEPNLAAPMERQY
jgi:hypothetical protein